MNTERLLVTSALLGTVLVGACSNGGATGASSGAHTTASGSTSGPGATSGTAGTTMATGPGTTASSGGSGGAGAGGAPTTAATTGPTTTVTTTGAGGSFTSGNGATVTGAGTGGGDGVSVQWTSGCWENYMGVNYQAMEFEYTAPMEYPIEATLFYNTTCDPSDGTDNLNDNGTLSPMGVGWIEWFIHHPGEQNTSAIWSLGNHSTGCVNYANAPPCM